MTPGTDQLDQLSREELIAHARRLGVERPEVMTRVELKDEIVRRIATDEASRRRARGWLGVARDLVASLIEQGLNMPDAAKLVRSAQQTKVRHQAPVATVTLAEIYATQGHVGRALAMLDEVLDKEPEHELARALRDRLRGDAKKPAPRRLEPEPEIEEPPESEEAPESVAPAPPSPPARDAIVTIVQADGSVWTYWELAEATVVAARARWPGAQTVVRLIALVPSWDGARRVEREIEIETASGSAKLEALGERAVIRAALGFRTTDAFHPIAVGTELAAPNGRDAESRVLWAPSARRPLDPLVRDRAIERYAES